jgi:hypothetical protein
MSVSDAPGDLDYTTAESFLTSINALCLRLPNLMENMSAYFQASNALLTMIMNLKQYEHKERTLHNILSTFKTQVFSNKADNPNPLVVNTTQNSTLKQPPSLAKLDDGERKQQCETLQQSFASQWILIRKMLDTLKDRCVDMLHHDLTDLTPFIKEEHVQELRNYHQHRHELLQKLQTLARLHESQIQKEIDAYGVDSTLQYPSVFSKLTTRIVQFASFLAFIRSMDFQLGPDYWMVSDKQVSSVFETTWLQQYTAAQSSSVSVT